MTPHSEIFAALQDAITAYNAAPELTAALKKANDDLDFKSLELEDARQEIERLKSLNATQFETIAGLRNTVMDRDNEIRDLRQRNEMLDDALVEANASVRNLTDTVTDQKLIIGIKDSDIADLKAQVHDSRGYATRLAEMLKGFGSAIATAVAEPEVSADKPFPAPNPVGLSVSASPTDPVEPVVTSVEPMEGTTGTDLVTEYHPEQKDDPNLPTAPEPFHGWATAPTNPAPEVAEPKPEPAFNEAYQNLPWWAK